MFSVQVVESGHTAVLQCKGRIVRSDAAYALREMVTAQVTARVVVLDLSEVEALEGGALGMLVFLQRWTRDNGIKLKLFNPQGAVRCSLDRARTVCNFELVSDVDVLAFLGCYETRWGTNSLVAA
jgi:anti-anti-sigma regulatory factor